MAILLTGVMGSLVMGEVPVPEEDLLADKVPGGRKDAPVAEQLQQVMKQKKTNMTITITFPITLILMETPAVLEPGPSTEHADAAPLLSRKL